MATIAVLVASYLVGSLNFAIIVSRIGGFPDPRTLHSGNAGASNVARVAGRPLAGLVLLLDMARAVSVQWVAARSCSPGWIPWAGLALILGNRFPLFHGFRGGKGVATYLGFVGAAQPWF
ncbi:MAG TPA: glycerol-3-phosphate acyltransferase, partial [Polyangia bacterium]